MKSRQDEILDFYKKTQSYAETAQKFKISRQRVYQVIQSSDIKQSLFNLLKKAIKERDERKCKYCGLKGRISGFNLLVVHHIDQDPTNNDQSNLITLHSRCHLRLHAKLRSLTEAGRIILSAKLRSTITRPLDTSL